jgi:hypothetical protein
VEPTANTALHGGVISTGATGAGLLDLVTIRPGFPDAELPQVWEWLTDAKSRLLDDEGPKTLESFLAFWNSRLKLTPCRVWSVYRGQELGGILLWRPHSRMLADIYFSTSRSFRERKTIIPAIRAALTEIFAGEVTKIFNTLFLDDPTIGLLKRVGSSRRARLRTAARTAV